MRGALAAERARCAPGEWLLGWGLTYDAFGGGVPSADAVADVTGEHPAYVTFFDYHSALASRPALAAAGVEGPRAFGAGASVVCDDAGVPTGMLREAPAMALVEGHVPARTHAERLDAYAESLRRLNALGITGAHVMLGWPWLFDDVETLEARGDLTVRCVLPLLMEPDVSDDEVAGLLAARAPGAGGAGAPGWRSSSSTVSSTAAPAGCSSRARTARAPSPTGPTRSATPRSSRRCAQAGLQCATHAIGDRAVAAALDAYRDAGARGSGPHRVEHIETLRDDELPRFAAEGVAASMQPLHAMGLDEPGPFNWRDRLQPAQVEAGFRWADLVRSGAILALGSDWPVVSADPRPGLAWARLRRAPGQPDRTPFHPEQALSAGQALAGYTTEAARIVGEAALGGRIAVGLRADLTGLGADPVDCPPDELPDVPVRLTVVDGEIVHRAA